MKKIRSASKAVKKETNTSLIVQDDVNPYTSYLDRAIIHALNENNITVEVSGRQIYLSLNKGKNHHQLMSLPDKKRFLELVKTAFKVDLSPYIIKQRELDCFTCNMACGKCLDPKTCGDVIEKETRTCLIL